MRGCDEFSFTFVGRKVTSVVANRTLSLRTARVDGAGVLSANGGEGGNNWSGCERGCLWCGCG